MPVINTNPLFYIIAGAVATPELQLRALIKHNDKCVRARVAENPRLPAASLSELASDESSEVRIAVAENASTPIFVLELLSEDLDADVRYAMAENASTPEHILHILIQDENPYVVARACKTLARLQLNTAAVKLRCCA